MGTKSCKNSPAFAPKDLLKLFDFNEVDQKEFEKATHKIQALPSIQSYIGSAKTDSFIYTIIISHEIPFFISTLQNIDPKPIFFDFRRTSLLKNKENKIIVVMKWDLDNLQIKSLQETIATHIHLNFLAVSDRQEFLDQSHSIQELIQNPDAKNLLTWLENDNFTYLGFCEIQNSRISNPLGLLRHKSFAWSSLFHNVDYKKYLKSRSDLIVFLKSSRHSPVHRHVPLDLIFIRCDKEKKLWCFVGLYTSVAYSSAKQNIPFIYQKILGALHVMKVDPYSYEGKLIRHLVDTLPYDEIIQCEKKNFVQVLTTFYKLNNTDKFGTIVFPDPMSRYTNIILYIPNHGFDTEKFIQAQKAIEQTLNTQLTLANASLDLTAYGLVHYRTNKPLNKKDYPLIEKSTKVFFNDWKRQLFESLHKNKPLSFTKLVETSYFPLFTSQYQVLTPINQAMIDLEFLQLCESSQQRQARFFFDQDKKLHLKIYNFGGHAILSDSLGILENFGLKVLTESEHHFTSMQKNELWIHDMQVTIPHSFTNPPQLEHINWNLVVEGLHKNWLGDLDDTYFNSLMALEGLSWKECVLLKSLSNYLRQISLSLQPNNLRFIIEHYQKFFGLFVRAFNILHNPNLKLSLSTQQLEVQKIWAQCKSLLNNVTDFEDERWLRCFMQSTQAVVRTNYFSTAFTPTQKPRLALKFNTKLIDEAPEPKPFREIFVYSLLFEGIHLRSSRVARGGIRWSDRREDFRTEILGLLSAQIVKNSIIIPAGAKGGFVLKKSPQQFHSNEEYKNFAISCYKKFIQSLLDITDNNPQKKNNYICYDEYDPYLVVAADKGTSDFSDYANDVVNQNNFWLGDAFASGGKNGYNHKSLGITAKGAWESAKHHFFKQGIDVQKQSIRIVGIGDMSGDVFGNGMLCSDKILLVAAFDHRHIFIDPTPEPITGFKERKRLFNLSQCSWDNYNRKLISKGGGIFSRHDRKIKLSPQIQTALGIPPSVTIVSADALVRYILMAPVDMLWLGGIGTFICATHEDDFAVKDPRNNQVRIKAKDLRCKVVVEGANLGVTQAGRIEFAHKGGIINTDSIDNSAGVNCSDYEVNLKIIFQKLINKKEISLHIRNKILASIEKEVIPLILSNNIMQNNLLSFMEQQIRNKEDFSSIKQFLSTNNLVVSEKFSAQDPNIPLTRPELSLVISYVKNFLIDKIVESSFCNDRAFDQIVYDYFPHSLRKKYLKLMQHHPLRKNIIATTLVNIFINKMGADFPIKLQKFSECSWDAMIGLWFSLHEYCTQNSTQFGPENRELTYSFLIHMLRNMNHKTIKPCFTFHTKSKNKHTFLALGMHWLSHYVKPKTDINQLITFVMSHNWAHTIQEILPYGHEEDAEKIILYNHMDEIWSGLFSISTKHIDNFPSSCFMGEKKIRTTKADSFIKKIELAQNLCGIIKLLK